MAISKYAIALLLFFLENLDRPCRYRMFDYMCSLVWIFFLCLAYGSIQRYPPALNK